MIWLPCTTSRLSVTCSGDGRLNAQSDAAWSAAAIDIRRQRRLRDAGRRPATASSAGSPAGGGVESDGSLSMSSNVWSGARMTQPIPSRNAARMTGAVPAVPIGDRLPRAIDDVVAAGRRADRLRQELQLLRVDLFERPVGREQAVAHQDGLLPAPDHLALACPSSRRLSRCAGGCACAAAPPPRCVKTVEPASSAGATSPVITNPRPTRFPADISTSSPDAFRGEDTTPLWRRQHHPRRMCLRPAPDVRLRASSRVPS